MSRRSSASGCNFNEQVSFLWSVADLLRGPYKPAQYGKVILPLTVHRRLDADVRFRCLGPTRKAMPTMLPLLSKMRAMAGSS